MLRKTRDIELDASVVLVMELGMPRQQVTLSHHLDRETQWLLTEDQ